MNSVKKNNQAGQIMIFAIVFTAVLMLLSAALVGNSVVNTQAGGQATARQQALYLAEAGLDNAVYQLNQNQNYSGETNTALGAGTFSSAVSTIDQYTKKVTVNASVPYRGGAVAVRTLAAIASIDLAKISFSYGIQVGGLGLVMNNGSVINGNVFSNGSISGQGTITGDASVAAGVAPSADQAWTVQNASFSLGNSAQQPDAAQSFIPSAANVLTKASFYLKKIGSPGDLTVKIVTDDSGAPSKTAIGSGTISTSLITGSYGWVDASLDSNPSLTAGVKYWLILIAGINSANYYNWGLDTTQSDGRYSDDWQAKKPVWTASGGRFDYQTYLGGSPTSLSGVTVNGNVRATSLSSCTVGKNAYYLTTNTCTVNGSVFPNTAPPSPPAMPISAGQISDWETVAQNGGVINGDYVLSGSKTVDWLGPIKINGNFTIDNGATLYLRGPIWVNGDITLDNQAAVIMDITLGNNGTPLIADYASNTAQYGKVVVNNNAVLEGNGQANSFSLVITTYSGEDNAISINNNVSSSIFYAPNGSIEVKNNATVTELTGKSIILDNNVVVNYTSGLQDASFSNGPGGSWIYKAGTYAIVK